MGILQYMDELEAEILRRYYGAVQKTFGRMVVSCLFMKHMIVEIRNTVKCIENMVENKNCGEDVQYIDGIGGLYSGFMIWTCYICFLEILMNF